MAEQPRFIKFLRGDRRSAERRSDSASPAPDSERRLLQRRANAASRRRSERRPVPLGPGAPSGALINSAGVPLHVNLWDVSEGGVCVVAKGEIVDRPGTVMVLELHSGVGVENVRFEMQLVWAAFDEGCYGTFVGLQFPEGQTLPRGTFLDRYLSRELPN